MTEELLVGLEIHQQLAIPTKLFCGCPPVKSEEFPGRFERRLRPAQSETGRLDPAALFEHSKGKSNLYFWNPESSCLVEADEEPPHPLSAEGLESALLVATSLGSNIIDEVHVMRKIVIDGSNTGGFQRTAVVGLGGSFEAGGDRVGVQSVTLEEDAARNLGEDGDSRRFGLDRLGVALVEIALDPIKGDPEHVGSVALHLGRILRSTGRAARGLGTIRQDMNVSLAGGKVVEVKGVQKLNLVPKVVEYERRRQSMLRMVSEKLRERGVTKVRCRSMDVTAALAGTASPILRQLMAQGGVVSCISASGLGRLLGWEPEPGVRRGKELAEVARAGSLGGVIHSDEFERQGLTKPEANSLMSAMGCGAGDGLLLVAGRPETVEKVVPVLVARLEEVTQGVPAETRAPTDGGETRYMRPRPGSQRMYPETDIPDIEISKRLKAKAARAIPEDWASTVEKLQRAYSLSEDMALKLYDSDLVDDFVRSCGRLGLEPSFIASTLVDLPSRLAREGVFEEAYSLASLAAALEAVDAGRVAKEAVPDILRSAGERGVSVGEVLGSKEWGVVDEGRVADVLEALISRKSALISELGEGSFSPLMGEAMKELRGRADGSLVARILRRKIAEAIDRAHGAS